MSVPGIASVFIVMLCWTLSVQGENSYEAKLRLESGLLTGYRKDIRPVVHSQDKVTITVGISLNYIKELDDKNQVLSLSLWFRQKWVDPRLAWMPSEYARINTTQIDADLLWVPDLKVYNEAETRADSGLDQFKTKVIVKWSGEVMWNAPAVMKLSCNVDVTYFPYDTQVCRAKIGSWTYDGYAIDVKPESYEVDISKSPSNPEWVFVNTSVQRNVEYYACCTEPYVDVTYTLTMKRRMQSYWVNFLYPGILLTSMTMMAFLTPASDVGERVGLVLTSLVSMFVFLKMVADRTPASDTTPLLSVYFVFLSFEIAMVFYSVCVSVNAYHKHPSLREMPRYIRSVVLRRLGDFWGVSKERNDIKQKLRELQIPVSLRHCEKENDEVPAVILKNPRRRKPGLTPGKVTFAVDGDYSEESRGRRVLVNNKGAELEQGSGNSDECGISFSECSCVHLLRSMIVANRKMACCLQGIVHVARRFDESASKKEQWLLAATILDRCFGAVFAFMFIVLTLSTLLS